MRMEYTVISDRVFRKVFGDVITEKELLDSGVNIDALVAGGHIQAISTSPKSAPEGAK